MYHDDITRAYNVSRHAMMIHNRFALVIIALLGSLSQQRFLALSFLVLPESRGSVGIAACAARELLTCQASPILCTSSAQQQLDTPTTNRVQHSRRTITMTPEIRASPRWERFWSAGLKQGDMWDTGVVSPALQNLLDEGEYSRTRMI